MGTGLAPVRSSGARLTCFSTANGRFLTAKAVRNDIRLRWGLSSRKTRSSDLISMSGYHPLFLPTTISELPNGIGSLLETTCSSRETPYRNSLIHFLPTVGGFGFSRRARSTSLIPTLTGKVQWYKYRSSSISSPALLAISRNDFFVYRVK